MTDQEMLLQAVLESPEEDNPRRVYADYLIQKDIDPAYGEFIHLQIDIANTPEPYKRYKDFIEWKKTRFSLLARNASDLEMQHYVLSPEVRRGYLEEYEASQLRELDLFQKHHKRWFPWRSGRDQHPEEAFSSVYLPLVSHYRSSSLKSALSAKLFSHRGFINEVHCSGETWQEVHVDYLKTQPVLKVVIYNPRQAGWYKQMMEGTHYRTKALRIMIEFKDSKL